MREERASREEIDRKGISSWAHGTCKGPGAGGWAWPAGAPQRAAAGPQTLEKSRGGREGSPQDRGQDRSSFSAVIPLGSSRWGALWREMTCQDEVGAGEVQKAGSRGSVPLASWHGGESRGAGCGDASGPGEGGLSLPVNSLLWQQRGGKKPVCAPCCDSFRTIYGKRTPGCKALFSRPSEARQADHGGPEQVGPASAHPIP